MELAPRGSSQRSAFVKQGGGVGLDFSQLAHVACSDYDRIRFSAAAKKSKGCKPAPGRRKIPGT
jgi:hypothetical protein